MTPYLRDSRPAVGPRGAPPRGGRMSCSSCGSGDFTILTMHPSGNWLVECNNCHYRFFEAPAR